MLLRPQRSKVKGAGVLYVLDGYQVREKKGRGDRRREREKA